jgi:hypothetical protein
VDEGESHPRILIRQRHDGLIHPSPGHQPPDPTAETILFLPNVADNCPGSMNQQLPEIPIPSFTDSPEPHLPPGAGMLRHQPHGRREVATMLIELPGRFAPEGRGT